MEFDKGISKIVIWREVFKAGAIIFLLASIIPVIHTIYFLASILPPVLESGVVINSYGEAQFGLDLGYLICNWLICTIPLTISSLVGKRILFTEKKKLVYLMPAITIVLVLVIIAIGPRIIEELIYYW